MRLILVATDGSAGAGHAVDAAAAFAKAFDADLLVVTIAGSSWDREVEELARSEGDLGGAVDLLVNAILREAKERGSAGAPQGFELHLAGAMPQRGYWKSLIVRSPT